MTKVINLTNVIHDREAAINRLKARIGEDEAELLVLIKIRDKYGSEKKAIADDAPSTPIPRKKRSYKKKKKARVSNKKLLPLTEAIKGILKNSKTGRTSSGISKTLMRTRKARYKREKRDLVSVQKAVTGTLCHLLGNGEVVRTKSAKGKHSYLYEMMVTQAK